MSNEKKTIDVMVENFVKERLRELDNNTDY